jgi:hypothetical protein
LFEPVAVGPQQEVNGQVWFFYSGPPKSMPLKTFVITDTIHQGEFRADLPQEFLKQARQRGFTADVAVNR